MDAFFASVEQQCNPHYRNKPIAITGSGKRTIITTASYEARAFGIKTGMTVWGAKRLCPQILFIVGNNQKYTDTCIRIVAILKHYSSRIEVYSIDESFVDLSDTQQQPLAIATDIKKRIKRAMGLTCSIGIAPNKLIAKLASDINKPNGLTQITSDEIPALLENLPVNKLCGIGNRLTAKLLSLGVETCGQLGRTPAELLRRRFGIIGEALKFMGQGTYNSHLVPMEETPDAKSIGHSMTLEKDEWNLGRINRYLLQLAEMVSKRMRRESFCGTTVSLIVRYGDFQTFKRQKTIKDYINDTTSIYRISQEIFSVIKQEKAIRLLGISVSNLKKDLMLPLLEEDKEKERLTVALDKINDIYGDYTVTRAALLKDYKHKGVISPSWRPEGTRRY